MSVEQGFNPAEELSAHYTKHYGGGEKHDSPEMSRVSMIRRMIDVVRNGTLPAPRILDVGSGPQSLIRQLRSGNTLRRRYMGGYEIYSIDQANIPRNKLLAGNVSNVHHARADGSRLPFPDETFGLVVSNHAIDFMDRSAFAETSRVLAQNGTALFYFHHPKLTEVDEYIKLSAKKEYKELKPSRRARLWKYFDDNDILFESEQRISEELTSYGLKVESVFLNSDDRDTWWEVEAHKV